MWNDRNISGKILNELWVQLYLKLLLQPLLWFVMLLSQEEDSHLVFWIWKSEILGTRPESRRMLLAFASPVPLLFPSIYNIYLMCWPVMILAFCSFIVQTVLITFPPFFFSSLYIWMCGSYSLLAFVVEGYAFCFFPLLFQNWQFCHE